MKNEILSLLPPDFPWRETLYYFPSTDSTNTQAKTLADAGAPHGTAVIAQSQTDGRGRMGRSFHSPAGGVYLTVILRPVCRAEELLHLTCAAGVAAAEAVEKTTGFLPGIKWINDLILGNRKVGGILSQLSIAPDGLVNYALLGIGINCEDNLPEELRPIATSLNRETGQAVSPAVLSAALLQALHKMDRKLLTEKESLMDAYRKNCITCGKEILLRQGDRQDAARALTVGENGELLVEFPDGSRKMIASGEASIRGVSGYVL